MAEADHGSPYAEFFSSPVFRDALRKVPTLSEDLRDVVLMAVRRTGRSSGSTAKARRSESRSEEADQ